MLKAARRSVPNFLVWPTEQVVRLRIGFDVMSYNQVRDADSMRAPTGPMAYYSASSAALARSGRRIAFANAGQLWLYDRDRGVATRAHTGIIPGQFVFWNVHRT